MGELIYRSIIEDIKNKINCGEYKSGEKLPTELELKTIYQTSKSTVRNALKILADEGYVTAIERRGNFVKTPNPNEYILFFDEADIRLGIDHTEIIAMNLIKQKSGQTKYFSNETMTMEIKSIYRSSEIPVAYDIKHIAYRKGMIIEPQELKFINILDILLQQIPLYKIKKDLKIGGCKASREVASRLGVKENDNVVKVEHLYFEQSQLIAYCETYYRAAFFKLAAKSV